MRAAPIFLFTDFGSADIYVGQVKSMLHAHSPASAVVELANDLAPFEIAAAAHLLAALAGRLPEGGVTIAVVDPGVGSTRAAVAIFADGRWFVGPDNGLLSVVTARATSAVCYELDPLNGPLSASFHGRDLFAPHAAALARGDAGHATLRLRHRLDVELGAADLARIIHVDHYGNAITGIRAALARSEQSLLVRNNTLRRARVFSDTAIGELFWYENSIGLIEIAANQTSAARLLGLAVGDDVRVS